MVLQQDFSYDSSAQTYMSLFPARPGHPPPARRKQLLCDTQILWYEFPLKRSAAFPRHRIPALETSTCGDLRCKKHFLRLYPSVIEWMQLFSAARRNTHRSMGPLQARHNQLWLLVVVESKQLPSILRQIGRDAMACSAARSPVCLSLNILMRTPRTSPPTTNMYPTRVYAESLSHRSSLSQI